MMNQCGLSIESLIALQRHHRAMTAAAAVVSHSAAAANNNTDHPSVQQPGSSPFFNYNEPANKDPTENNEELISDSEPDNDCIDSITNGMMDEHDKNDCKTFLKFISANGCTSRFQSVQSVEFEFSRVSRAL